MTVMLVAQIVVATLVGVLGVVLAVVLAGELGRVIPGWRGMAAGLAVFAAVATLSIASAVSLGVIGVEARG